MSRGSWSCLPPRPCPPDPCPPMPRPPMNPCMPSNCGCGNGDASMRVRLFEPRHCEPRCGCSMPPAAPPVTICNPWNPNEIAVVTLSLDECGNLVVCVRRENRCGWR